MKAERMMLFRLGLPLLMIGSAWGGSVNFSLQDAQGITHTAAELGHDKATVFIFVATECPNSNTYAPILARLYRDYSPRGVAFFNVYSDPSESAATVRKHDADFGTPFAALLDPHQTLARETGARSTPEVVILGAGGQQLYRGRVDNRFIAPGKTRYQATENDLDEALAAILQGKAVPHPVTRTIGCAIPGIE
jgi:thiol-disulfide isomerase/thioredoxin